MDFTRIKLEIQTGICCFKRGMFVIHNNLRRQSYLGQVNWMSFDGISGGRKKILLASESGVLAAVNAASGKIGMSSNTTHYCVHYLFHSVET